MESEETKSEVICCECNKAFKNKRALLTHSRIHDSNYMEKKQLKKEQKKLEKQEQEKPEEKVLYLKITENQFRNINSTYIKTIQHKIDCRNRAREK